VVRTEARFSTRSDGDFRVDADPVVLEDRRRRLVPDGTGWTWLHQVHGTRVVTVHHPGEHAGAPADAAVTDRAGAVLAVHTADCAPVLLSDTSAGVVGAAHVGWRGLAEGVLEATVEAMAVLGATTIRAVVGPHIRARCYEFGADALEEVAARYGDGVRATTSWGTPALDLLTGVRSALDGCESVEARPGCTACEPDRFFSHRARVDAGRHAATVVLRPYRDQP
jgi:polyphenol oxidase